MAPPLAGSINIKTPPAPAIIRYRRGLQFGALVAVAVFIGSGLWFARWEGGSSRATPDTFWYARDAFRYAGYPESRADGIAAEFTCQAMKRARPRIDDNSCRRYRRHLPISAPIRFQRIFTSRPGYPLLTAPFVRAFGRTGFVIGTAALGVACGVAIVVLALVAGLRLTQAFLAEILFYLLPTGLWASRMLAEAPMMLFLIISMIGAILLVRGPAPGQERPAGDPARPAGTGVRPAGMLAVRLRAVRLPAVGLRAVGLLAVGLSCLCVVKPANGVALSAALVVAAAVRLPFTRARPAFVLLAAVAAAVLTGNLLISAALRLPSLNETLQDTFTHHFHRPDATKPWYQLAIGNGRLWGGHIAPQILNHPFLPAVFLLAAVGMFRWIQRDAAWSLSFAGLTGAAVISLHPVSTETARLTEVSWVPVALGLALWADLPFLRRRHPGPDATVPESQTGNGPDQAIAPAPCSLPEDGPFTRSATRPAATESFTSYGAGAFRRGRA